MTVMERLISRELAQYLVNASIRSDKPDTTPMNKKVGRGRALAGGAVEDDPADPDRTGWPAGPLSMDTPPGAAPLLSTEPFWVRAIASEGSPDGADVDGFAAILLASN